MSVRGLSAALGLAAMLAATSAAGRAVSVAGVFPEALELRDAGSEGFIEIAEGPTKKSGRRGLAERQRVAREVGGLVRWFARHRRVVGDRQEVGSGAKDAAAREVIPTGTRLA